MQQSSEFSTYVFQRHTITATSVALEFCTSCNIEIEYQGLHDGLLVLNHARMYTLDILFETLFSWYRGASLNGCFWAWLDRLDLTNSVPNRLLETTKNSKTDFNDATYQLIRIMDLWGEDEQVCRCVENWVEVGDKRYFCPEEIILDGVDLGFSSDQIDSFETLPISNSGTCPFHRKLLQFASALKLIIIDR